MEGEGRDSGSDDGATPADRLPLETPRGFLIVDALTLTELPTCAKGSSMPELRRQTVRRISKDTRTLVAGDLYLALSGENHDGNVYAKEAAAKGAAGAILDAVPSMAFPRTSRSSSWMTPSSPCTGWRRPGAIV